MGGAERRAKPSEQSEARRVPSSGSGALDAWAELLDQISRFLIDNRLPVTPRNLLAAHAAFSGGSLVLGRRIAQRQMAGEPITQEWLDELIAEDMPYGDAAAELEQIRQQLDGSLERFGSVTSHARSTAGAYNTSMAEHVAEAESRADGDVRALIEMTRKMLDRSQAVEAEMAKTEAEVVSLRRNLARAQRDAEIDHLTGLPNRRAFEAVYEREYAEARAAIEPLSVAFCDIDHFKKVNDTHGHEVGDRVIQTISEMLAHISNDTCHVARHGGEEFVLLFRGLTPVEAHAKLDNVREKLAGRKLVNRDTDTPLGSVTFSGGVTSVFAHPDPRAALRAADEALYRAKEAGRNRIEIG